MNAAQQAMPWGALSGDRLPDWETPWPMFRELERMFAYAGRFTVDVCASKENAKCPRFFTEEDSCLIQPWGAVGSDECAWLQPPFGDIDPFVRAAVEQTIEQRRVKRTVGFFPMRTDRAWWHRFVVPFARVHHSVGRAQFDPPVGYEGDVTGHAEPMAIVVWEHAIHLPDFRTAPKDMREPGLLGLLVEVRKEAEAENITGDPLAMIAELDQ